MGCNCKGKNGEASSPITDEMSIIGLIIHYAIKLLAFFVLLAFLPIIMLGVVWIMFTTIVLNKDVNMKPLLTALGQKFNDKNTEERDADDGYIKDLNDLTEDDVILMDSEEITSTTSK